MILEKDKSEDKYQRCMFTFTDENKLTIVCGERGDQDTAGRRSIERRLRWWGIEIPE